MRTLYTTFEYFIVLAPYKFFFQLLIIKYCAVYRDHKVLYRTFTHYALKNTGSFSSCTPLVINGLMKLSLYCGCNMEFHFFELISPCEHCTQLFENIVLFKLQRYLRRSFHGLASQVAATFRWVWKMIQYTAKFLGCALVIKLTCS